MPKIEIENLVKAEDIAPLLKKTPRAVYQLAVKRKIPHYRIGATYLFDIEEIKEWIKSNYKPAKENNHK
jgi:excisionase family DNA binding protein